MAASHTLLEENMLKILVWFLNLKTLTRGKTNLNVALRHLRNVITLLTTNMLEDSMARKLKTNVREISLTMYDFVHLNPFLYLSACSVIPFLLSNFYMLFT